MAAISQLEQAALLLAETIQTDWEQDLPSSTWLGAEGERVRDNALTLVQAARSGTLQKVLGGVSIHAYLGQAWLDLHSKSYEQANAFRAMTSQGAA